MYISSRKIIIKRVEILTQIPPDSATLSAGFANFMRFFTTILIDVLRIHFVSLSKRYCLTYLKRIIYRNFITN